MNYLHCFASLLLLHEIVIFPYIVCYHKQPNEVVSIHATYNLDSYNIKQTKPASIFLTTPIMFASAPWDSNENTHSYLYLSTAL